MKKILLIEDNSAIVDLIGEALRLKYYEVVVRTDGLDGFSYYMDNKVDFIIISEVLTSLDGFQLLNLIRKNNRLIPIIMLARSKDVSKELDAFNLEADDYIYYTVSMSILMARIEAILRRSGIEYTVLESEDLKMKTDSHEVWYNDKRINLTIKEFEILHILLENKNRVMTRENIHERVWGYNYGGEVRNIDTHIKNMRYKMPEINIKTVIGLGYKYVETKLLPND